MQNAFRCSFSQAHMKKQLLLHLICLFLGDSLARLVQNLYINKALQNAFRISEFPVGNTAGLPREE
jgi:hypothetical protein